MHREHLKLIQEALKHDLPTILSGEEIRRLCSALEADARALWAVRVLDAWAAKQPGRPTSPSPNRTEHGDWWVWITAGGYHIGPDPDAARLAAATALYPDLPEAVRRELGECP